MQKDDVIYRQAAIDAMNARLEDIKLTWRGKVKKGEIAMYLDMRGVIEILPSAEPVRHGKWIYFRKYDDDHNFYQCTLCKSVVLDYDKPWYLYCPNCGARLDEE